MMVVEMCRAWEDYDHRSDDQQVLYLSPAASRCFELSPYKYYYILTTTVNRNIEFRLFNQSISCILLKSPPVFKTTVAIELTGIIDNPFKSLSTAFKGFVKTAMPNVKTTFQFILSGIDDYRPIFF